MMTQDNNQQLKNAEQLWNNFTLFTTVAASATVGVLALMALFLLP
ncbi:MAG: aa3-type cytochrome c oxidase subunit IV [Alphaproteobacteria bacterium]|nr:aa3-type cytochrome c oxidase subunit IV [Alphaproteobacteria bacterium]